MLSAHFFDLIPIWLLLIGTIAMLVLFIEFGFRLGQKVQANSKKPQTSQLRAIMDADLRLEYYPGDFLPLCCDATRLCCPVPESPIRFED